MGQACAAHALERGQHPVVLLPGFMADGRVYEPVLRALSGHVLTCVAPLVGGERVEDVAATLLQQLPSRFTLVGAGLGATVAMEILQRAPARICGLGLIAGSPLPEMPAKAAEREPWIVRAKSGRLRGVMQEVFPSATLAPGPDRSRVLNDVADMAEALGTEAFVAQSRMLQRRGDYQAVLRRINVASLIISGAHDQLIPLKRQMFMAELMGQARLEVLEGAGHLPLQEEPARVAEILHDWIVGASMVRFRHSA